MAGLVELQGRTGAAVVTCPRILRWPQDGAVLNRCTESDGVNFNDMNCYLLTRPAFPLL